jgi:hypothetical protein
MEQERQIAYERGLRDSQQRMRSFDSQEYRDFQNAYQNPSVREWVVKQGAKWDASKWTTNAPATYNHLFLYPAFVR